LSEKIYNHKNNFYLVKTPSMNLVKINIFFAVLMMGLASVASTPGVAQSEDLWGTLKSGNHIVLIRHALAPGYSDPKNFDLKDCQTQRNLNEEGRLQSKKIGDLFRSKEITHAAVFSSQWCRCRDTAKLLNLGEVSELPVLNSFFENFERRSSQTDQLREWIKATPLKTPTILISHQVNIAALTGYSPSSGEIVFLRRELNGTLRVIGSISTLQ
jgi:phosphohistidine phosphatase SixA